MGGVLTLFFLSSPASAGSMLAPDWLHDLYIDQNLSDRRCSRPGVDGFLLGTDNLRPHMAWRIAAGTGHLPAHRRRRDERHPRDLRHGHSAPSPATSAGTVDRSSAPSSTSSGASRSPRRGDLRGRPRARPGARDPRRQRGQLGRLRADRAGPGALASRSAPSSRRLARSACRAGRSCSGTWSPTCSARSLVMASYYVAVTVIAEAGFSPSSAWARNRRPRAWGR